MSWALEVGGGGSEGSWQGMEMGDAQASKLVSTENVGSSG